MEIKMRNHSFEYDENEKPTAALIYLSGENGREHFNSCMVITNEDVELAKTPLHQIKSLAVAKLRQAIN
ncbi:MAG: hypothetical protein LBV67_04630 [Streptococcaceae bacterium]|jgi:hypothetical protein|nr:hypothetical protein [Streptococcaceae bacterium]